MSLLDDARRMIEDEPLETDRGGRGECHYCRGGNYEGGYLSGSPTLLSAIHKPDCPWLSLPKIVAALEAAEQMVDGIEPTQYAMPYRIICQVCHSEGPDWSHTATCVWARLKETLEAS